MKKKSLVKLGWDIGKKIMITGAALVAFGCGPGLAELARPTKIDIKMAPGSKIATFQGPIRRLAVAPTNGEHTENANILHRVLLEARLFPEVLLPSATIGSADHIVVMTAGTPISQFTFGQIIGYEQTQKALTIDTAVYDVKNGTANNRVWGVRHEAIIHGMMGNDLKLRELAIREITTLLASDYRQYQATNPSIPSKLAAQ
jgi:hypothetical protein